MKLYQLIEEPNGHLGVEVGGLRIYDVTTERTEADELLALLKRENVSQVHVYDVIECWFAQRAYSELGL